MLYGRTDEMEWLESLVAKVLSLIAFGVLCIILFWQGLQRPPAEMHTTLPDTPPANGPP